jgi:hypothetical protein
MKFHGNFGELILEINGMEASGNYQKNGRFFGKFIDNTFKGQWKNNNMEGLLEFTVLDNKLEGRWKKGLDSGPMNGKWKGKLVSDSIECKENFTENNTFSVKNPIIEFLNDNLNYDFSLKEYQNFVISFLNDFDLIDNENDKNTIELIYEDLLKNVNKNISLYGGCVYLFKEIVYNVSEGEVWLDFNFEIIKNNSYSLSRLLKEGTPVKLVCKDYNPNEFKMVFITKMIFTLLSIIDETDDYELIAEMIVGSNIDQFTNSETDDSLAGDWINDIVIQVLKIMGYDLYEYEGTTEITARYFMESDLSTGYDYIRLAENFYESNI